MVSNPDNSTALTNAIQTLIYKIAAMPVPPVTPAVYDPYAVNQPFNIATRVGAQAYTDASAPFDELWDGNK